MRVRRFGLTVVVLLCAFTSGLALSVPALALNVHVFSTSFGGEGSEPGKLKEPGGVAVNNTTHNVYVVDRGNARVEEFTSTGVFIGQFAPPGGFGESSGKRGIESPSGIAVDNSGNPLDPSAGDVYVADRSDKAIDKFSETGAYEGQLTMGEGGRLEGVAVDPNGVLWVSVEQQQSLQVNIESFSDTQVNLFRSRISARGHVGQLAVNSEDNIYLVEGGGLFSIAGSGGQGSVRPAETGESVSAAAVDVSDDSLYLATGEHVSVYDTRALLKETFGSGHLTAGSGIAVDSATHAAYVADSATNQVVGFNQVVVPDVSTGEEPSAFEHEGSVTLDGTVNPDGIPVTSCEFEYGTETSYGGSVPCEHPDAAEIGKGSSPVAVHAVVNGLTPLALYHYRLVAANTNGSNPGGDRTFVAPLRPKVDGESVANVASSSATLGAQIDASGADATYRFEYGTSSSYGSSISGDAGSGVGDVEVTVHPQDLQPGTTYHYRVLASNIVGGVEGEDRVFVTQAVGGAAGLPDGRGWELVSPVNKQGVSLLSHGEQEGDLIQAAVDGSAISYATTGPTEEAPAGDRSPENVQVLSVRDTGGWTTKVIATPHDVTHVQIKLGSVSEYRLFSSDLSLGLVVPEGETPLSEESSERTPYLRHDGTCKTAPAACYQPLVTASNVVPGTKFDGLFTVGETPDLSHVILKSSAALTPGGASGLYEWAAGKLTFVGSFEIGASAGRIVRHAVSDDGSRVIGSGESEGLEGLLMRDLTIGKTIKLDTAEPGGKACNQCGSTFQTASSDGSRVFFTSQGQLTTDSKASETKADLYEFDVETGKLVDLSVTLNPGEAANVQGLVLGASEDGSYVYFVAEGVLSPGAVSGEHNLYVRHGGVTRLVAMLSPEDNPDWGGSGEPSLSELTARVSPNGRWLAFMSDRSLTGYDNRDVSSGQPDEEVFLFDASTGRLVCASCDPTGARPAGIDVGNEIIAASYGVWNGRWLAASILGWTASTNMHAYQQSRYLSDSGRLFFNSSDGLVPQDTNGTWDVYQYEPPGEGSCRRAGVTFSEASGGCVGLISSGGSQEESGFMDASENGNDVFFMTASGLVSQDYDGALDVYDAHVCTASSPCAPPGAVVPPSCSTGDSCKAAPSPQPVIFGAPSSETFSGAGNVVISGSGSMVTPKSLSRAQRLTLALKGCRKKRAAHRRMVCERQARRRFAKKAAARSTVSTSASSRTGR